MEKIKVLITGAQGQLGNEFRFLAFTHPQFQFIHSDVDTLDITKLGAVRAFFAKHTPQYVINCAAYTAVDKAESEPALAAKINTNGPRNLAKICTETGATLLHISTDYVYHNRQNTPFKEGDATSPKGVYARTKLRGDLAAMQYCDRTVVVRTSWVYGTFGHNFVKTMRRLGAERAELGVVFDQIGTPTYARDLARTLLHIVAKLAAPGADLMAMRGVFHYSNEGVTSWYDFTQAIFELSGITTCTLKPIESAAYPTPAQRPPFSVLNKAKIKAVFGLDIPHWRDSLAACIKDLG